MALPDPTIPHCEVGPDGCFGCRSRFWRRTGGAPLSLPMSFRAANRDGYTQAELGRDIVQRAKAEGREIERAR
jgi:hypothetical protein